MRRNRELDSIESSVPKNKKLVSFSHANYETLISIIRDEAYLNDTSESAVIENALVKAFFPANKNIKWYIDCIYSDGLKATFSRLFAGLAAGTDFKAAHDNALPLVKFAMDSSHMAMHGLTGKEGPYVHFQSQCGSIYRILEHKRNPDTISFEAREELEFFGLLIKQLPENFVPINYYNVILANWDILGNSTFTFRLLMDLVELTEGAWKDTPERRAEARKIITEVVGEWG